MFVLVACSLVLAALVLYWFRIDVLRSQSYRLWPLAILPLILFTLVLLQYRDGGLRGDDVPVFVSIVSDVSLSMGTQPEPRRHAGVGTRLERANRALLPLLTELETTTRQVMVGVTAFTSKAETILAWDDNLPQIREAIEYVLTPGLLTESGSDLGVGLQAAGRLFGMLPPQTESVGKFLILVSDGEQNVNRSDVAKTIADLHENGVRIITLHVGLEDTPEGLPVFDEDGGFMGFEQVGDQLFSVPDPAVMRMIAGSTPDQGMFVKAEDAGAPRDMMQYIGVRSGGSQAGAWRVILIVTLWGLTTGAMLRHV